MERYLLLISDSDNDSKHQLPDLVVVFVKAYSVKTRLVGRIGIQTNEMSMNSEKSRLSDW